ncbi:MAG: SpoIIE family protein phosphatase [Anaerolineaceae bacterium]
MEIQIAVSKINKQALIESGDTLEIVERPSGGISVVLADGRGSGNEAKKISSMIANKVINFLGEGTRDGVAARTISDYLFSQYNGEVTAFLSILSVDLETQTITITSNNPVPVFVSQKERMECVQGDTTPIGSRRNISPAITQLPLEVGLTIVMYTDGLAKAGDALGIPIDLCTLLESLLEDQEPNSQSIADTILSEAIRLEQSQPQDDMSVVVLRIEPGISNGVRKMNVTVPVIGNEEENL